MVSLSPGANTTTHGARFFSEGNMDDDSLFSEPILSSEQIKSFVKIKTIPVFSLQVILSTVISITGIILALHWPQEKRCEAYYIMQYLHVAFWLFSFVIDHVVHYHHNNLRLQGYHAFYRETTVLHRLPLYVVSLWNAVLLVIQTLMQHFYSDDFTKHCIQSISSPSGYVALFVILETAVIIGINGRYIYKAANFNSKRLPPDVLKGEWTRDAPAMSGEPRSGSVGFVQRGGNLTELLEKQADLISYLQEHNSKLSQKLMIMNAQLKGSHSNIT